MSGVSNAYRDRVNAKLESAGEASGELLRLLAETKGRQREWAEFLVANMPPRDLGAVSADVVMDHLRNAEAAQGLFPWTKSVPRNLFLHYVLPYRVSQEPMEKWRGYLLSQLQPRLKNTSSMAEAALEVNRWAGENVKFKPTEFRDQGPLETLRAGYGRCEEMTITFIAAARSVGLPARCASTPWWATCDNNHAWVEVWADGRWWCLGACEPAATLDEAWFRRPARRAAAVYSACFGTPETDELVYRKGADFTYVNTTRAYSDTCDLTVCVADKSGNPAGSLPVVVSVFNYGALRPIARRAANEQGEAQFVLGLGEYVVSCGTDGVGESARVWKIIDTRAGTAISGEPAGDSPVKTQLREKIVLTDSATPDAKFWLRYPKLE